MTSFWDRIKSKEKTAPVDNVGALRASLSKLDIRGEHHRFLVNRMGSSGSTWLVKLLNSHPDVFCYHEGVLAQIYPLKSYTSEHVVNFIRWLAWDDMHGAYKAIGAEEFVHHRHALAPSGQNAEYQAQSIREGQVFH